MKERFRCRRLIMSLISIRLADKVLNEVKASAHMLHMTQTEYIRKAIERMNEEVLKEKRKQKLAQASLKVREESMNVNKEFSRIEHDPEA